MAKFIEVQTRDYGRTLLNLDDVKLFFTNGGDVRNVYYCCDKGMTKIEDLDWETLKSMIGDSLIQLNKD